jgi:hypothetical protein
MALSEVMKRIDGEPIFDRHLMRQGAYLLHNVIDEAINKALMSGGLGFGAPVPQAIPAFVLDQPAAQKTPLTIAASDDERYCYIRSSKLKEYYSTRQ